MENKRAYETIDEFKTALIRLGEFETTNYKYKVIDVIGPKRNQLSVLKTSNNPSNNFADNQNAIDFRSKKELKVDKLWEEYKKDKLNVVNPV